MSTKIYYVYLNNLIVDTLLITDKELSEINIKDVIANVETYEHYQDEYENDFYKINNKDIVSFSILDRTEKIVVEKIVVDKKEEKVIEAKELKVIQEYKKACFSYYFNLNLPKDEEGKVNDNVNYYLGIKDFLEKNFRYITNNEDNSVYERWEEYREEAKKQAKEFLKENRL